MTSCSPENKGDSDGVAISKLDHFADKRSTNFRHWFRKSEVQSVGESKSSVTEFPTRLKPGMTVPLC